MRWLHVSGVLAVAWLAAAADGECSLSELHCETRNLTLGLNASAAPACEMSTCALQCSSINPIDWTSSEPRIGCTLAGLYSCSRQGSGALTCDTPSATDKDGTPVYSLPSLMRSPPLCTDDKIKLLLEDHINAYTPAVIYSFLILTCQLKFCSANHRMKYGEGPCLSRYDDVPQLIPLPTKKVRFCEKYARTRDNCQPLPICRGDTMLVQNGQDSMPLIRLDENGKFVEECERLCTPGVENNKPTECRRIPSVGMPDDFQVGIFMEWCHVFEILQVRNDMVCNKRPFCEEDGTFKDSWETNPHGSSTCVPLQACAGSAGSIRCRNQTDAKSCPAYVDFDQFTYLRCELLPVCFDRQTTTRKTCEALCDPRANNGVSCRRIPTANRDKMGVIPRIVVSNMEGKNKWFNELAQIENSDGTKPYNVTPETFDGFKWCTREQSILRNMPFALCNPRPLCKHLNDPVLNAFYANADECISEFRGCNATEAEKYLCSSTAEKPWCALYEMDSTKLETCQRRPLCDDIAHKKINRTDFYILQLYKVDCEKICSQQELIDYTDGTKSGRLRCRPLPSKGADVFFVAQYDASRLRGFCSTSDSLRRHPPMDCNPLPLCDKNGDIPSDSSLNPYFANTCVKMRTCSEGEKEYYFCNMEDAQFTTWLYWILPAIFVLFLLLIAFMVYKKARDRQRRAKRHSTQRSSTSDAPRHQ